MKRALSILVGLAVCHGACTLAAEIRFEDVMYLDEIHAKPLPLKVKSRVALTVSRDQSTVMAYLQKDDVVWLIGIGESRHYVEAFIPSGQARGWVDVEAIEAISEEIRGDVEHRVRKNRRFKELIARKEIDIGMTRGQVEAALGKPTDRKRTVDGEMVEEEWTYRSYKNLPQRDLYTVNGRVLERTYYRKVFAGGKTVLMRNDEVVSIREEQTTPEEPVPTISLPPPIVYPY